MLFKSIFSRAYVDLLSKCQVTKYKIYCYDQEQVNIYLTDAALINVLKYKLMLLRRKEKQGYDEDEGRGKSTRNTSLYVS
jgi:hypothetical protein